MVIYTSSKCNINRYLIWVNKILLLNKQATVLAFSEFTLSTSTNEQRIHGIRKLQIPMLSSYLHNYHLNKLSRLSGLIGKFTLFRVTGCLLPRKSRKSGLHCCWMNFLFHQLINSYPFYSVLNECFKGRTL